MSGELRRLTRQEAIEAFRPGVPPLNSEPTNELERDLRKNGIAQVALSIHKLEFQELSDQYDYCIDEHEGLLDWTAGSFDEKGVPEDGHISKKIEFNDAGMQIVDPKSLIHFNNNFWAKWSDTSKLYMPQEFREFVEYGFELRAELTKSAKLLIASLESYPRLSELYFPNGLSDTTLRLIRYDGYRTRNDDGKLIVEQGARVAKAHYDRGGMTIQAYASEKGFWCKRPGFHDARYKKYYPPYGEGQSQMFFGAGFRAIHGSRSNPIKPLYHGVDQIFDESLDFVPPRTAAILFTDAPLVDVNIKGYETQPERLDKRGLDS